MNLNFSGRGLAFLHHYEPTLDIRYYLAGVYVRPLSADEGGGVLGVATNGHIMGAWRDPEGVADRAAILRISPGLAAACRRAAKKAPRLVIRDGRLTIMTGDDEVYVQPNAAVVPVKDRIALQYPEPWEIAAKFPDVFRVVDRAINAESGPTGHINAELLSLLCKSLPKPGGKRYANGLRFRQDGASDVVVVTCPDVPEMMAAVMPIRCENNGLPAWLPRAVAAAGRQRAASDAPLPVFEPSDAVPPPDFVPAMIGKQQRVGRYPA